MGPADRASRDGPRGATRSLVFSVDVKMMDDVAVSGSLDFLIFLERAWVIDGSGEEVTVPDDLAEDAPTTPSTLIFGRVTTPASFATAFVS